MKKLGYMFLLMITMVGLCSCSAQPIGSASGIGLIFDGEPLIFDASVVYKGTEVGRILSRERGNGITRIIIAIDGQYEILRRTNLTGVVKYGRLHLNTLGGYGDPLPPEANLSGFLNMPSYHWFKLKQLLNDITMAADRRAQRLLARSGLAG